MRVSISQQVLQHYPQAKVAVLLARVQVKDSRKLKGPEEKFLSNLKQEVIQEIAKKGITSENYSQRPVCQSWDKVFSTFNVGEDKHSTINHLLSRAAKEADKVEAAKQAGKLNAKGDLGKISNFVDLYNCVSLKTETPMGALDVKTVEGDITLRYGQGGETFIPLGKKEEEFQVQPEHIIYADNKSVLTWLWNHRDAKHCCVPASTDQPIHVVLFADQAEDGAGDVEKAIDAFIERMPNIQCELVQKAVLDAEHSEVELNISQSSSSSSSQI